MKKQNRALLRFTVGRIVVGWRRRTSWIRKRHQGKEMGSLKSDLTPVLLRMALQSAQELSAMSTAWDQGQSSFLIQAFAPAELMVSHNLCAVSWSYLEAAVDSVLDASLLGEFSTKAHRICPTRLRRLFFWMDLYLCMRKLGTGESVAYFSFFVWFYFVLQKQNRLSITCFEGSSSPYSMALILFSPGKNGENIFSSFC